MNQDLQPAQDVSTEVALDIEEDNGAGAQDSSDNNAIWTEAETSAPIQFITVTISIGQMLWTIHFSLLIGYTIGLMTHFLHVHFRFLRKLHYLV
ncbi:hypothetical protein SERLA73DRAFT_186213 [Serpula lacrymans var. lacrymans S7.3]|uniref:Uncharacterized protein n=2 Tax=Serpula lacrymans var. lacrymans TaxID=341189 RepID=F8Q5K3_SERL3|nr:uncharacterized protein SERLADRAFT_475135 [Serpula lacrymans var. lacrymans S7.9]EGN96474.1 hypothetical protein SERLA73DRAFT_186213 [Serpula lacrymans var. lacrymans S7.3]EGO22022.1 hypothetical protein SERLADRAFT_475135 [Serpula lacrymans var. lacrymans S7.9]